MREKHICFHPCLCNACSTELQWADTQADHIFTNLSYLGNRRETANEIDPFLSTAWSDGTRGRAQMFLCHILTILDFLPSVTFRLDFKVILLVYKSLEWPKTLNTLEMLTKYKPNRPLRWLGSRNTKSSNNHTIKQTNFLNIILFLLLRLLLFLMIITLPFM